MAEQGEHPQRVGRPPVVLVAVDHHGVVPGDALGRQQRREALAVEVVACHRVVELGVPVDLDGAGDVAGLVEQHVLVGLDHDEAGGVEALGEPRGRDQPLRVGVLGKLGVGVVLDGHCCLLRCRTVAVAVGRHG